jgi:hypothetical protein
MSQVKIQTGLKLLNLIKKSNNIELVCFRKIWLILNGLDKKLSKYDVTPDKSDINKFKIIILVYHHSF